MSGVHCPGVNCPGVNYPESNVLESNVRSQMCWSQMSGSREICQLKYRTNGKCCTYGKNWDDNVACLADQQLDKLTDNF